MKDIDLESSTKSDDIFSDEDCSESMIVMGGIIQENSSIILPIYQTKAINDLSYISVLKGCEGVLKKYLKAKMR